jgi:hypothetical protein
MTTWWELDISRRLRGFRRSQAALRGFLASYPGAVISDPRRW